MRKLKLNFSLLGGDIKERPKAARRAGKIADGRNTSREDDRYSENAF